MNKIYKITLAMMLFLVMMPVEISAEENDSGVISGCPLGETIDTNDIINVEIIDGELYIDVLTELEEQPTTRVNIGEC